MARFKKKPVVILAEPYQDGLEDGRLTLRVGEMSSPAVEIAKAWYGDALEAALEAFTSADGREKAETQGPQFQLPYIKTLEGNHFIRPTDFIVTGVAGERYPVKKEIFDATYEPSPDGALPCEITEADKRLTELVQDYAALGRFIPATRSLLGGLSTRWEAGERTLTICQEIMSAEVPTA
jgi:hypothetical protein